MHQIGTPRSEYVEKIIRDSSGRFLRATFCIYESQGRLKARLIKTVIFEDIISKNEILVLIGLNFENKFQSNVVLNNKIISPFVSSNILYFTGSKPRAPTAK